MFCLNKSINNMKMVNNRTFVNTSSSLHSISPTPSTEDGNAHLCIRNNKLGVSSVRNEESYMGITPKSAWTYDAWLVVPLFTSIFSTKRYPE